MAQLNGASNVDTLRSSFGFSQFEPAWNSGLKFN
jgi:hypothetical protein